MDVDIHEIARSISENIDGWCGARGASLIPVGQMVSYGKGNHIEIGSLWGASAIMAAKVQEKTNPIGHVYCIDPMEYKSHEPCSRRAGSITPARAAKMREVFMRNVERMGVVDRITLINKKSQPWPSELEDVGYSSVFIDGWHYGDTPLRDAKSSTEGGADYILLDDAPLPYYPAIEKAFRWLVNNHDYFMVRAYERSVLFMKRPKMENIWFDAGRPMPEGTIRGDID